MSVLTADQSHMLTWPRYDEPVFTNPTTFAPNLQNHENRFDMWGEQPGTMPQSNNPLFLFHFEQFANKNQQNCWTNKQTKEHYIYNHFIELLHIKPYAIDSCCFHKLHNSILCKFMSFNFCFDFRSSILNFAPLLHAVGFSEIQYNFYHHLFASIASIEL